MKSIIKFGCFIVAFSATQPMFAASGDIEGIKLPNQEKIVHYWTAERLANAKEMPSPRIAPDQVKEINKDALGSVISHHRNGMPPTVKIKPDLTVHVPQNLVKKRQGNQYYFDRGTSGFYFTSSRLNPMSADLLYPYSAIGRLFFTIPGVGDFTCSASTINQRIIVTAGHCVHAGEGGNAGYFTNFLFIPSYRQGMAPFQMWAGSFALTTDAWATGGGEVPNAADYAMIEVGDVLINGSFRRLGNVTGAIGWLTNAVMPNHIHTIGYPCNFDSCEIMHQVMAQTARMIAPNNAEIGSDMGPGSSGSPWIQNFGPTSVGQTGGYSPYRNVVVGVTSYGYTDPNILIEGTSIFDTRFLNLYNNICAHRSGNCI